MDVFFPATKGVEGGDSLLLTKRTDLNLDTAGLESNEVLKDGITTVVGAVLDKQQCWEKAACLLGRETRQIAAKDLIFLYDFNYLTCFICCNHLSRAIKTGFLV